MFKINLVPEVQQQKQKAAKRNTVSTVVAITIVGSCVATLFIIGAVKVAKNIDLNNTNEDIEAVKKESEQYKELEETVLSLEKGLAGIKQILSGDNTWTKLLPHLEAATPKDVQFTRLSIEGGTAEAELKGKSIDSLAKIIESYKEYQVVVLSGTAAVDQDVSVIVDDSTKVTTNSDQSGNWNVALRFSPDSNHSITVVIDATETKLSYDATTKALTSPDQTITAEVKSLFANLETTQYRKEGSNVAFDLSFTFDEEAIW